MMAKSVVTAATWSSSAPPTATEGVGKIATIFQVRLYDQQIVFIRAPELRRGQVRLALGMRSQEVVKLLGAPGFEVTNYRRVFGYDLGRDILAVVLEEDRVVSLQLIRKFHCSTPRGDCAYYPGWWRDHLTTETLEMPTLDVAWPWHRTPSGRI